ncbi:MAG: DUF1801 domain-containing protein [Myxococcota bacterium]
MLNGYERGLAKLALEARKAIKRRSKDCWELIYHTYALSTAFSLSEHLKDAFCHVAVYRKHVNLGFNRGTELDDPAQLLQGSGRLIRHVRLGPGVNPDAGSLGELIDEAINHALRRMTDRGASPSPGSVVVKQNSSKR